MEYFLLYQVNKGRHGHRRLQPSHLSWWALRTRRMWTHRKLFPESCGAHQRAGFSGPRLLQLPTHREALHTLTARIWFLWLTGIFWCPDHLPFAATLPCILASPVASSEKFLRNTVSRAAVLILPHMKLNSQFNVLQLFSTLYTLKTTTKPVFKNGSIRK